MGHKVHMWNMEKINYCEKNLVQTDENSVVPPSVYQGVTLVFRESSGFSCACDSTF